MLVLQALLDNQLVVYGCTAWFDTFLCSIWFCVCLLSHIQNKVKLESFEDVGYCYRRYGCMVLWQHGSEFLNTDKRF